MDADDLGCATPDQENCENSHDDHMYQAINRFIGTQEQSYEEFLGAFSCLTADDVTKFGTNCEDLADTAETSSSERNDSQEKTAEGKAHTLVEDIEEEVLVEGSVHGTMSASSRRTGMVKFDNFVETEDEQVDTESKEEADMEELLGTSGYTASFLECVSGETTNTIATDEITDAQSPSWSDNINLMTTNFGEVEPEEDITHAHEISNSHTTLDITSSNQCSTRENAHLDEVSSDVVEDFHLDPHFDYDNVKLTPKYSEDDLTIILSDLKTNSVSTAH